MDFSAIVPQFAHCFKTPFLAEDLLPGFLAMPRRRFGNGGTASPSSSSSFSSTASTAATSFTSSSAFIECPRTSATKALVERSKISATRVLVDISSATEQAGFSVASVPVDVSIKVLVGVSIVTVLVGISAVTVLVGISVVTVGVSMLDTSLMREQEEVSMTRALLAVSAAKALEDVSAAATLVDVSATTALEEVLSSEGGAGFLALGAFLFRFLFPTPPDFGGLTVELVFAGNSALSVSGDFTAASTAASAFSPLRPTAGGDGGA